MNLVDVARAGESLAAAADAQTRLLVDGFVHQAGPPPSRFAWVAMGSHARGELHCASDQDHALFWERTPSGSYATDLAQTVIAGLEEFGMRRCDGGYMADTWSYSVDDWAEILRDRVNEPTPDAIVDAEVFLDMRPLTSGLAVSVHELAADSPRLLHGLAVAANSFPTPLHAFGRMPKGELDLKKTGLAPIVLLARLYGLRAGSIAVSTDQRLADATAVLGADLCERLRAGYQLLSRLRLQNQLRQLDERQYLTDRLDPDTLSEAQREELRDAFRAIKAAQSVTAMTFRTDL